MIDGDTLRIEVDGDGAWLVRLAWVDAPESRQAHGDASRAALAALVAQRRVRIEPVGEADGVQRAVVRVAPPTPPCRNDDCPMTVDVGEALLLAGHVWHDRRRLGQPQASFNAYEAAEFQAKARRFGLWSGRNPMPPWDWRRR